MIERSGVLFDRLIGIWPQLANLAGMRGGATGADMPISALAAYWREQKLMDRVPDDRRDWLQQQLVIEAVDLWDRAGDVLQEKFPEAYALLSIVSISSGNRQTDNAP